MGYSPVTRCMQSGNQKIFDIIVNFIREQRSRTNVITTEPCDDELGTIMSLMEFPINPNFTPLKCFTLLLKPLYFNLFYVIKFMHLLGVFNARECHFLKKKLHVKTQHGLNCFSFWVSQINDTIGCFDGSHIRN